MPQSIPPIPPGSAASPVRFTVLLGSGADAVGQAWHRTACGLLEAQGVQTLLAQTGREVLGLMEQSVGGQGRRIHVAVRDQRLPDMGGLQVLRRLQQAHSDAAQPTDAAGLPPAILLADAPGSGLMQEALTARVFSVLPKPIELDLLLDTLARALRRFYQNKWPGEERMNEEG